MTAERTFSRALELVDHDEVRAALAAERIAGKIVGFGIATFIEPAPGTAEMWQAIGLPFIGETARVAIEPDGHVSLHTQQTAPWAKPRTTLAQICADELGVALDDVRVVYGDTQSSPFGLPGTSGSRAATFASGATVLAAQAVRAKILTIAAADARCRSGRPRHP